MFSKLSPLKESNSLNLYPKLEFKENIIPDDASSPTKLKKEPRSPLQKPPIRISPFKGKLSHMSNQEIFSVTPKRLNLSSKTQSVDRTSFVPTKPEITFESLKGMAGSTLKAYHTPSRMITGRKRLHPNSEVPVRSLHIKNTNNLKDPRANLIDKFNAQKSILKKKSPEKSENTEDIEDTGNDTDMTTEINTMKNAVSNDDIELLLKNPEFTQPRKRRAVTFEEKKEEEGKQKPNEVTNQDIMTMLQRIMKKQYEMLERLENLEKQAHKPI
ncbi:hypothetical protein WICMUC_001101 [Wickerhamomyces mucosus]|uniref:Uncharacterized protein n=1 Tax=Wickerhamomyces mucosus TaxID=1378264 RepID=A0A9P8PVN9_9ASCO|nr:hypothetical protein WICMUC_001101 [Wickerhamomyces mucosus]